MRNDEIYIAKRLSLIRGDWKYTFLNSYQKGKIDVLYQHLVTGEVKVRQLDVMELDREFYPYTSRIIGEVNRPVFMWKGEEDIF